MSNDGRQLLEYRYVPSPYKPYAVRLFSPSGVQVLRDAPSDHKHHHVLMFAVAAANVNFWEENEGAGTERPRSVTLGLKIPSTVSTSGGIFKYDDYGREGPDTFNMCLDFPERVSLVLVCTLANNYMTEPAIRGDEGTITLQNPVWEVGCDSVTVHRKGAQPTALQGEKPNSTLAHWKNFLQCVHTREKPVSDVEFGYHVQAALCMGMSSFLKKKVARFDPVTEEILL